MGLSILSVTFGALVLVGTIDFFSNWYRRFLTKRPISQPVRIQLNRILWAVFAVTFWGAMLRYGMPEKFETSHFLFALFIYSVRGLIVSCYKTQSQKA